MKLEKKMWEKARRVKHNNEKKKSRNDDGTANKQPHEW